MIKELPSAFIGKTVQDRWDDWKRLPLGKDVQSLFLGISAFSKREKEIIGAEEGFYRIELDQGMSGDCPISKLASELNLLIFDSRKNTTYRATIGPMV